MGERYRHADRGSARKPDDFKKEIGLVIQSGRIRRSPMRTISKGDRLKKEKPTYAETASVGNVGAARFELTTSWSQTRRDTGLRYAPLRFYSQIPLF
jgi:hypothetical protein